MFTTRISCACGKVECVATGTPIAVAACHCDDCQAGSRQIEQLPNAAPVRATDDGTEYVLYRKDRFACVKGSEWLRDLRLKESSPTRRVVAGCCNSAMYLDFEKGHWISAYRARLQAAAPPLQMHIQTRFRPQSEPLPDAAPAHRAFSFLLLARLLLARIAMLVGRNGLQQAPRGWLWTVGLAALLLAGTSARVSAAAAQPENAILMAAQAEVADPFFEDSLVLVMNNLGPGPVGLIVNRPTPVPISRLFPQLKRLQGMPDKLYFGGPVDIDSVWFLIRTTSRPQQSVQVLPDVYLSASRALLTQLLSRSNPMQDLRIFVGHAGWTPEQLRAEINSGAWALKRAAADTIFKPPSEHPWPPPPASKGST